MPHPNGYLEEMFILSCKGGDFEWIKANITDIKAVVSSTVCANGIEIAFGSGHDDIARFLVKQNPAHKELLVAHLFYDACRRGSFDVIGGITALYQKVINSKSAELILYQGISIAVDSGYYDLSKTFLQATMNERIYVFKKIFNIACREGNLLLLEQCIKICGSLNTIEGIYAAAEADKIEIVRFLVESVPVHNKQHFNVTACFAILAPKGDLMYFKYFIEETPRIGFPIPDCRGWSDSEWGKKIKARSDKISEYLDDINSIQQSVGIEGGFQQALAIGVDTYRAGMRAKKKLPASLSDRPQIKF